MKYWCINYVNENDEDVVETYSEQEIIEKEWKRWCDNMQKAGKNLSDYTFQDCIDDWIVVNWAWESTSE